MPERHDFDPDERVSLYPMEGEEVLRRLLGATDDPLPDEDEAPEDESEEL